MNLSWKKGVALGLAAFMTASMMPTGIVKVDAAAKNAVTAKSTTVKVAANNVITLNKAAKNYKVTVAVTGKAKSGVTVKYGKSVLVKNGKTQKAGKNQVLAQKTSIKLTATAAKSVVNKKYQVKVTYYNAKGKKVATKTTNEVKVAPIPVSSVTLNKKTATVNVGKTVTLKATVKPNNATNKTVTWTSSNKKIATVTNKGVVKGIKAGTATITAKSGTKKATCKITVKANTVAVTGVALNPTELNLTVGNSGKLTATVSPANATNKTVTWKSSDTNVATVSGGTVKAVGKGEANITATAGGKTATAKVTVVSGETAVQSVVLSKKAPIEGDVLETTITPADATNPTYVWYTSNTADGELTPIEGQTASTLAVDSSMIGKFITVVVNAGDDSTAKDVTTSAVVADPKVTVDHAELDNTTPKVGATITAEAINSDDEVLEGDVTYQWYRVATAGSGATGQATPITGANKASYTVQSADLGFTLYCCVIDKYGNEVETEATQIIASTTFTATITGMSEKAPGSEIENVPVVGDTLKVELSDAGVDEAVEYQWYRDNAKINGATEPEYTVVDNDYTYSVRCEVKVKDSYKAGYTLKEQPAATKIVGKSIANAEVVVNPKGANVGTAVNFYVPFDVNRDGEIKAADHDYLTLKGGVVAKGHNADPNTELENHDTKGNVTPDATITLYRDEVKNTNRIPATSLIQGASSGNLLNNQYVTYTPDKADAGHTIIAVVDGLYDSDFTVGATPYNVPVDYAIGRAQGTSNTVVQALKEADMKVDGTSGGTIQYVGQKLSVDVVDMLGQTVSEENLSYVWKRAGLVIGTGSTYTLTEDDITQNAVVYSVEVSAADAAYTGVVTDSSNTTSVQKGANVTVTVYDKTQGRLISSVDTTANPIVPVTYGAPALGDELEVRTIPAAAIDSMNFKWENGDGNNTPITLTYGTGTTFTVPSDFTISTPTPIYVNGAKKNASDKDWDDVYSTQTENVAKAITGISTKYKKVYVGEGTAANNTHNQYTAILDSSNNEQFNENAEVGSLIEAELSPNVSLAGVQVELYKDQIKPANKIYVKDDGNTDWKTLGELDKTNDPATTWANGWSTADKNNDGVDDDRTYPTTIGDMVTGLPASSIPASMYGHKLIVVATPNTGDYDGAYAKCEFDVEGSTRTLNSVDVTDGNEVVKTLQAGAPITLNNLTTSDGEKIENGYLAASGATFAWHDTTDNKLVTTADKVGSVAAGVIEAGHHYKLTITPDGLAFSGDELVVEFDADATSAAKAGLLKTVDGTTSNVTGANISVKGTDVTATITASNAADLKKLSELMPTLDGVKITNVNEIKTTGAVTAYYDTKEGKIMVSGAESADKITFKATANNTTYNYTVTLSVTN